MTNVHVCHYRLETGRLLNYFNIHNMDMKRHMLIYFSFRCKRIGERSEIGKLDHGRFGRHIQINIIKTYKYIFPLTNITQNSISKLRSKNYETTSKKSHSSMAFQYYQENPCHKFSIKFSVSILLNFLIYFTMQKYNLQKIL
jgi:hypothetical protein